MFDLGLPEMILVVIVAVIAIGPKELPRALATAGRWVGKARRTMTHFRSGLDAMVREAELEEMEKKWAAENERIMREHPAADDASDDNVQGDIGDVADPQMTPLAEASSEAASAPAVEADHQPGLPLGDGEIPADPASSPADKPQ